ncbi:MAG: cytochrome c3 family protein [Balneolaceae bacterium]
MAQVFPKWVDSIPKRLLIGIIIVLNGVVFGIWYFFSPEFTHMGYAPEQPVPFSHKQHVSVLGLDCQYCHTQVFESRHANIPGTQTCMNCHGQLATESEALAPVRESSDTGSAIEWIRVYDLPDYAYFNHSAHVNVGVGCESCHGRVDRMDVVFQATPMSMSWCLDCHREPEKHVRPVDQVTEMGYNVANQLETGRDLVAKHNINAPLYCQSCHY